MKIESLKEFEKLVKLCRKIGVDAMEIDNIKFNLGSLPRSSKRLPSIDENVFPEEQVSVPKYNGKLSEEVEPQGRIETADDLTEEQKMFLSSDPLIAEQVMS